MRVLGLVASPRRQGNSEILVKEMMRILPGDWDKKMIQLNDLHIERCKACYACLPKGKQCIINDDLGFFLGELKAADKVIIASPVYFLGQHTVLKQINDRLISIQNDSVEYFSGKQCVIVIPHTVADWEGYAREATMHFARFLGLRITGITVINAELPGDVLRPEAGLSTVHRLALSLIDDTVVDLSDPSKVYCPECGSSLLQIFQRQHWRCVMCAAQGQWKTETDRLILNTDKREIQRFTLAGMEEHGQVLDQVKEYYIQRRNDIQAIQKSYKDVNMWLIPPSRINH